MRRAGGPCCGSSACRRHSRSLLGAAHRATACVVGAIIGELPSGLQSGLGGAIINFNQYYSIEPQELWATNIVAAALGIIFFVTVVAAEKVIVHRAPEAPA
jgi:ABC-type nitrate/sulfonate/bicarbonate transport system, permease component